MLEHDLKKVLIFQKLPPEDLKAVAAMVRSRRVAEDEAVVEYEDASQDVFFVLSGRLRVTIYSEHGREVLFRDLRAGEVFGEISAIDGGPRSASVIALEDSQVGIMTPADFKRCVLSYPSVCETVMGKLAWLVRMLSKRVEEFSLPVSYRICAELLRMARESMISEKAARITPKPARTDVANRINTHREAVSREFTKLKTKGIIRSGYKDLIVTDIGALRSYMHELAGEK